MSELSRSPDELEADIVVIGYGGAGAAAAITAHDSGADVIVLEKMPTGGGNTRVSMSSWFCPAEGTESQAVDASASFSSAAFRSGSDRGYRGSPGTRSG